MNICYAYLYFIDIYEILKSRVYTLLGNKWDMTKDSSEKYIFNWDMGPGKHFLLLVTHISLQLSTFQLQLKHEKQHVWWAMSQLAAAIFHLISNLSKNVSYSVSCHISLGSERISHFWADSVGHLGLRTHISPLTKNEIWNWN